MSIQLVSVWSVVGGLLLTSLVIYAVAGRRLLGTTLLGPLRWWLASIWGIGLVEAWLSFLTQIETPLASALRYAAAMLTFCPTLSLLGAKRPQDRAWHLIVFTLWIVLILPVAQIGMNRSHQVTPPLAWQLLMLALLAIGVANRLGTRLWFVACLGAVSQWLLLGFIWREEEPAGLSRLLSPTEQPTVLAALAGLVLSQLLTTIRLSCPSSATGAFDRVWLDFRDHVGVLWAMRVAERFNATCQKERWPVTLSWRGLEAASLQDTNLEADAESAANHGDPLRLLNADQRQLLDRNLHSLIRRFVSNAWIATRVQSIGSKSGPQP